MVLTDNTDDNEENHYNEDKNGDDTRYMIHDDAWQSQHLGCSVAEGSKPVSITYFTRYWSVREIKFHEQGSKYDNKG